MYEVLSKRHEFTAARSNVFPTAVVWVSGKNVAQGSNKTITKFVSLCNWPVPGALPVLHMSVLIMNRLSTTETALFICLVYSLLPKDLTIQNLFEGDIY